MQINALVVDNDPVLLKLVSTLLIQEKCSVRTADNGLHALEILENYQPDIIFTDLVMPQVNGEQLCNILRRTKRHKKVFIVVLSATVLEDRERISEKIDCDLCIAKGNLKEIRSYLQDALKAFNDQKRVVVSVTKRDVKIPEGLLPSVVTGELLSEQRHLTKILENLYEGIFELNEQGKVLNANRAALEILSSKEENLIGVSVTDLCDWGEFQSEIEEWSAKQLTERGLTTLEIDEKKPFSFNDLLLTASFIPVADKDTVFAICIIRDITRQFRAEEKSRELDNAVKLVKRMDAMSCMAGGVAHDFNNLLTVIYGNLDIVTSKGKRSNPGTGNKLIQQAKQAALAAVDLTRQISGFSNFGIVSREQLGIKKIIRSTAASFFRNETCCYHIETRTKDCLVYVDSDEFSFALEHVLQNAVDAAGKGDIRIILDCDEFKNSQLIHGQYVPAGKYARIDIQDSGRGIDKEYLLRVFDPYYSTKERGFEKGIGLGLTVVYATLRNHGGYIVIDSELGVGTQVSLYIPEFSNSLELSVINGEGVLSGQEILIIEPDKQMGQIGRIMTEYLGLTVEVVQTRTDALVSLEKFNGDSDRKNLLVLLDLSEKQGGAADETCRLLHQIDPALKVIAMSGSILDPVMEDCKKFGFVATLPKPYTMDSLRHVVTVAQYS